MAGRGHGLIAVGRGRYSVCAPFRQEGCRVGFRKRFFSVCSGCRGGSVQRNARVPNVRTVVMFTILVAKLIHFRENAVARCLQPILCVRIIDVYQLHFGG